MGTAAETTAAPLMSAATTYTPGATLGVGTRTANEPPALVVTWAKVIGGRLETVTVTAVSAGKCTPTTLTWRPTMSPLALKRKDGAAGAAVEASAAGAGSAASASVATTSTGREMRRDEGRRTP